MEYPLRSADRKALSELGSPRHDVSSTLTGQDDVELVAMARLVDDEAVRKIE